MKKTELILKKAALFEKLSLVENKEDFLKVIAQSSAHEYRSNFSQLVDATKDAFNSIPPQSRKSTEALNAEFVLKSNPDINDVEEAIVNLTKIVPWMQSNPTNNSLMQRYNSVKSSRTLPEEPSGSATTPQPKANQAQSIDSLFNFYYAKLKGAGAATAQEYITKLENLVNKLDNMSVQLVTTNPKESTRLSTLADKGRFLIQEVRTSLGTQRTPTAVTKLKIPESMKEKSKF